MPPAFILCVVICFMKMRMYRLFGLLTLALIMIVTACTGAAPDEVHIQGRTMGTTYNVKYTSHAATPSPEAMQAEIDAVLASINSLMSTYDDSSELSRFNQWQSSEPFPMSAETLTVMKEALRLGELSDGVLDVTVGPLVNLWGFGPQATPEKVPSAERIAEARSMTGLDKLHLGDGFASKSVASLYVDLSTIAKGYGVDRIAELLASYDLVNYLVEIGGEMRVAGVKANGQAWRIAVEKPVSHQRAVQKILTIGNNAIATSGDYRNYYERNGVRYSHLIDPRSGYPIDHNLVAVTVVHPSSMTADGLATALNVMGKDDALALANQQGIAVLLIVKEQESFKEYTSDAFNQQVQVVTLTQ